MGHSEQQDLAAEALPLLRKALALLDEAGRAVEAANLDHVIQALESDLGG